MIRAAQGEFDLVHAWPRACLSTFAAARQVGLTSFRESPNPHTATAFAAAKAAAVSVGVSVPRDHSHFDDPERLAAEVREYAAADFILVPSEFVRTSYVELGLDPACLLPHRYGFDPERFPEPDGPARTERDGFTALFLGSGEPRKGLHLALEAWASAALDEDSSLVVAGRLEAPYEAALRPLTDRASVRLIGFQRDTGGLLRGSDVLLLPSLSEGSALVTYEAMASGVVPLVSSAAGAPVVDGVDGLVHDVGDVETLAAQLRLLHSDRHRLQRLRAAGLRRRDELNWAAAAKTLDGAYRLGLRRRHGNG
jgi:glycosyltransferase involved in cell wall biosynthesis